LWVPPHIVDIAATPSGDGYALLDANGFVFALGDAPRTAGAKPTVRPAVAIAITPTGRGYWVLGANGAITRYADAKHMGDAGGRPVQAIDLARTVGGGGYWIATRSAFPPVPPNSGEGRRIVYANRAQRIWLIEANGVVSHSYLVSGRIGAPPPGTHAIASKSVMSSAGSLRLPYMSRFYRASSGKWIGFHGIPLRPDGTPIQTDAQLGTPLSHGCVRMNQADVKVVWDFTPVGTTVVVVP
jgi:lipoprotein-anchoring transpeptidase ErfK/SrfK